MIVAIKKMHVRLATQAQHLSYHNAVQISFQLLDIYTFWSHLYGTSLNSIQFTPRMCIVCVQYDPMYTVC